MNVAGFLVWALKKPAIIVIVLLCAVLGGIQGWRSTTSHYETSASVLVIPPGAGSQVATDNPFANLGTPSAQVAYVLVTSAQSQEARAAVQATGASPDYTLNSVAGEGSFAQLSPQITFTVSAPEPWQAKAGAQALITYFRAQLERMQKDAGVTVGTYADLRVPVEPTPGVEVSGDALRAAVGLAMGAALGALLLCLIGAAALEALRQRRRAAATDPQAEENAAPANAEAPTAPAPASVPAVTVAPESPETGRRGAGAPPAAVAITGLDARRERGSAAQRAMTRWRDRVEEVAEESEFPLPELTDAEKAGGEHAGAKEVDLHDAPDSDSAPEDRALEIDELEIDELPRAKTAQ